MSKIMELRTQRARLWEQTKAFLEEHRGENGLVEASAVEQYDKMADDVRRLGAEIERLEQQEQMDAQLSAPTSRPVLGSPKADKTKTGVSATGTGEYKSAFWGMMRACGNHAQIMDVLPVGVDTDEGFTVLDEFERQLVQALEENNIFRRMAHVIRTSSGTRKIPIANDTMEASWIDEGEEIPETATKFGQATLFAYKLGVMIKVSNELLNDSAFNIASYIAGRFGMVMGNAEKKAFVESMIQNIPVAISMVLVLMVITNSGVEVLKKLTLGRGPTNIMVFAVAMIVTLLAFLAMSQIARITVVWYIVAGAIILGIFVAYAAMFGFDKLRQTIEQIDSIKKE